MPKASDIAGAVGEMPQEGAGFLCEAGQLRLLMEEHVLMACVACAKGAVLKSH